jgi:23S rRNA pseudouridine1911/1915/1917 synthase
MQQTGTSPEIPILFEDNHLLVINKPAGLLSQEDHTGRPDVLNLCKEYIRHEHDKPGNVFLGLLHRLDRPVSGVMVLAKTSKAASRISEQIRARKVRKRYRAVVFGDPPPNGVLEHHLEKDNRKNMTMVVKKPTRNSKLAKLSFNTVSKSGKLSLMDINLETGRAHQIRVQFAEIGSPIWGDKRYGKEESGSIALHAHSFKLEHPTLNEKMTFRAEAPKSEPWSYFK